MKRHAAVIFGLALTSSAQAIVIDNGVPEGTVGYFSADVGTGGSVSKVKFTTRRFDSPEIVTVSLVSQYNTYFDPGNAGGGKVLSGGEPFVSTFDGSVSSNGQFDGANGTITWFAFSRILGNPTRLSTNYDFSGEFNGQSSTPLGALRVLQYLDGDIKDGGDVLRVVGPAALETLGNTSFFGVAQSVSTFSFPPTVTQGAADIFNLIVPRIGGNGQTVSSPITIANLPDFVHPELGSVRGPGDVVSVLAIDADPKSSFMFVDATLRPVAPPPDPNPPRDSDGDGVPNPSDHCPGTPAHTPVQSNGCPVPDSDGDGVIDTIDDCPRTPPGTTVQTNGCPLPDLDGDRVPDGADNCVVVSNPDQSDVDGDGVGDVCDVTNPVPTIVNRQNVPCGRGKKCDVKLACPTGPNSVCKNTAIITIDTRFLHPKSPASDRVRILTMAIGVANTPPGTVRVIEMKLNRIGRRVIRANLGKKVIGKMQIFNRAGNLLSVTRIKMAILNSPRG